MTGQPVRALVQFSVRKNVVFECERSSVRRPRRLLLDEMVNTRFRITLQRAVVLDQKPISLLLADEGQLAHRCFGTARRRFQKGGELTRDGLRFVFGNAAGIATQPRMALRRHHQRKDTIGQRLGIDGDAHRPILCSGRPPLMAQLGVSCDHVLKIRAMATRSFELGCDPIAHRTKTGAMVDMNR